MDPRVTYKSYGPYMPYKSRLHVAPCGPCTGAMLRGPRVKIAQTPKTK